MNDVMESLDAIRCEDRARGKPTLRTPRVNLGRVNNDVPDVSVYRVMVDDEWLQEYVVGTELEDDLHFFKGKVPGFELEESDGEVGPPASSSPPPMPEGFE